MHKPFAIVLDSRTSLQNKTGTWRTNRPEYLHRLPPCNVTCPAGENIQQWLSLAQEGLIYEAWQEIVKNNPFPAIMGRACYHTCEKVCNRGQYDGSVNINLIERFIGDTAISRGWSFTAPEKEIDKTILVIGAGPSGLSVSYFLRKMGYKVVIYDAHKNPGGMMRYGVPRFRLPRNIIDAEIKRITDMGVKIVSNKRVESLQDELDNFDAIYLATGASLASRTDIDITEDANTMDAIDFLRRVEDDPKSLPALGRSVVIYGGGNTAIDAARTALRMDGVKEVKIIYRRALSNMPAHDSEIQDALEEGIEVLCLRTISHIGRNKVVCDMMNYDEDAGTLSKTGESGIIYADSVIFAIGQSIEESIVKSVEDIVISEKGSIEVDKQMMTAHRGIFAGGDVIFGTRTVTNAIGAGKKAAKCIDAYLNGSIYEAKPKHEVASFKKLNTEYYERSVRKDVKRIGKLDFEEKNITYSESEAIEEAKRCFSCGNCFHCDNCYSYCPDNAIIKHEDGSLEFNYEFCKGCGICESECPCGAIKMVSDDK